ncbi:Hypothetical predicted protein [Paramuricea clavata]|uniref:Uncharacterized protein n=1 Tax=Paramuricea clavata TaxID=317549 RepID=A0A7D9L032_PARCT|nr:Hypothetical predicted protein [Paramuricea clavata]
MSATREKEIILNFRNNIEYTLFNKDGVVNIKVLEQIESCVSEQREIFDEIKTILRFLPDGDYQTIFNGTFAKCILGLDIEIKSDYGSFIKEQISKQLSTDSIIDCYIRQLHILLLGIACLQLVVQQNWLGPPLKNDEKHNVSNCFQFEGKEEALKKQVSEYLRKDGEDVYVLAEFLEYLLIARTILVDSRYLLGNLKTQPLWEMRCILVHQQLLEDLSPSLKAEAMSALQRSEYFCTGFQFCQ